MNARGRIDGTSQNCLSLHLQAGFRYLPHIQRRNVTRRNQIYVVI
jgi:hypothetical protein